ncbi:hypothetical protein BDQ94DRAFT_153759 [Aspergillus welwitschiae]|uniref:AMP-binding enzyme C-terminal domain-containing protein n=1 Tax=Aspergillus welwitschiae TaxID=1341132 RepID=A0A3F3PLA8_9EURO|nr:hypothetical protein BDQ94DRAFT_153759 [Aspergillus welwitschiae]RDH27562.1 hypothetical protein BDQ94DRAFT_153759 [Aspergillus welwitschiae]
MLGHPGVADAAVVAVNSRSGATEVPVAFVTRRAGASRVPKEQEIINPCTSR